MRTHSIIATVAIATTLLTTGALAQTETSTTLPATTSAVSPASPMPTPNSVIYIPRLPTPAELANAAAAQGLAIEKIEQTSSQITVVYKYANGQINTVAYQLLPAASAAPAVASAPATVVTTPAPTVVYASPAPVYYYDPFYYDYGWPWSWPVSFDIGIGYGFRHGGYSFGYRHFGRSGFRRDFGHGFHHR